MEDAIEDRVRKQTPVETDPVHGRTVNTPQFIFESVTPGETPEKILGLVPMLPPMLCEFVDSDGKKKVRAVLVVKGAQGGIKPYIIRGQAENGKDIIVEPEAWFTEQFARVYAMAMRELSTI